MNNSLLLQDVDVVKSTTTFSVILSLVLALSLLYMSSSFQIEAAAQSGLLSHQDITNGFSVNYPSGWNKQDNVYGTHGVQFSPNPTTRDNVLIDVVQQPDATLDSWTQDKIDSISSRPGASILLLNQTTLGGNPAYKVEYMWEGDRILEMWSLIGDKLYAISYIGEGEESYQQNLSVAQSIIDSFQFTDGVSPPATISQPETPTGDSFLTYEDTARGFKMQYPSDWNKTDYPPTIPFVSFISPAQNATDNLFENLGVVIELLPMQNITLDQYSHGVIEQLGLESPDFNVTSPPKETMLGGVPAYNMTYTDIRTDENDPSVVHEIRAIVTWAVKDGKAYTILYAGTESQFNYSLHKAQKMIDSFSFVPPQQISISKSPQTEYGTTIIK